MSWRAILKCLTSGLYVGIGMPMLANFAVSLVYGRWDWHAPLFLYGLFFVVGVLQAWWDLRTRNKLSN